MSTKNSEWKVYFDGNFYGHSGAGRAGSEIPIGARFHWAQRDWLVPAAYACDKGLVVDYCMRVEGEKIRAFLDKWNIHSPEDEAFLPNDAREQFALENPLMLDFLPKLTLNGKALLPARGCSFGYIPDMPAHLETETAAVMAHYGLDRADGWVVSRSCYPWKTKRKPKIRTLTLTMQQQLDHVPGSRFTLRAPGDSYCFIRPATGTEHTITALEMTPQNIDLPGGCGDYPSHCLVMRYRVMPPLPKSTLLVQDTASSDRPRGQSADGAAFIGIIGGSDGPTAIVFGREHGESAAVSSLHYAPVDRVTWRLTFLETPYAEETFALI